MEMENMLATWFPFDIYLVVNYRYVLDDMIEIKASTWLTIGILLIGQAMIHRGAIANQAKDAVEFDFVIWLAVGQVLILLASAWTLQGVRKIYHMKIQHNFRDAMSGMHIIHRIGPVRLFSRVLQVSLFFSMYEISRTIASKYEWEENPGKPLAYVTILVLGMMPEAVLVGVTLAMFSTQVGIGLLMQRIHVQRMIAIVHAHIEGKSLRQMGDNVEVFDTLVEEEEESFVERAKSSKAAAPAETNPEAAAGTGLL